MSSCEIDVTTKPGCNPRCWTPVPCPTCGADLPPRGRSSPLEAHVADCCADWQHDPRNHRHLWNKHDSDRAYTDPMGWAAHVRDCTTCQPDRPVVP